VDNLVCAIGITSEPVDFSDDEEGKNCRIVILTLTPDAPGSPYMTFITAILTALRSEDRRKKLLEAPSVAAIKKALLAP
jgi:mannitol/fructose-specific phosphotransferase system IIA component (Ntr-type)